MRDPLAQLARDVAYALIRFATNMDSKEMIDKGLITDEEIRNLTSPPPETEVEQVNEEIIAALPPRPEPVQSVNPPIKGETLSEYLIRIRKGMNWTVKDAAYHAGINEGTLSRIEMGKNPPTRNTLEKIASTYKVKFVTLLNMLRTNSIGTEEGDK